MRNKLFFVSAITFIGLVVLYMIDKLFPATTLTGIFWYYIGEMSFLTISLAASIAAVLMALAGDVLSAIRKKGGANPNSHTP